MKTKYTKEYFLEKFEAIPEERWCVGDMSDSLGRFCALGFCCDKLGHHTPESIALLNLFPETPDGDLLTPAKINDGTDPRYRQLTPRARILAALRDLP